MNVKELIDMSSGTFTVVIKEPGECFKYSCTSNNRTNFEDFGSREVYEFDFDAKKVYCW